MNIFRILLSSAALCCLATFAAPSIQAQTKKKQPAKKTVMAQEAYGVGAVSGSSSAGPYLGLEPCAKETEAEIAELENAHDLEAQLTGLVRRAEDKDEWTRGCAVYRLGEFGKSAQDALPLIIKLVRDEDNPGVWGAVEDA